MRALFALLLVAFVSVPAVAESTENEITLRLKGGLSIASGGSTSRTLGVVGADLEAQMAHSFAMGIWFSHTLDSRLAITTFAINPKYTMNRGSAKFGFGALVGVQLVSESIYVASSYITSSDRGLALGVNASVDFPVYQSVNFSFVPAYIQRVTGNNQIGEIQFNSAFSFRF